MKLEINKKDKTIKVSGYTGSPSDSLALSSVKRGMKEIERNKKYTGLREFYPNQTRRRRIYEGDTILTNGKKIVVTKKNGIYYPREIFLQGQYNQII